MRGVVRKQTRGFSLVEILVVLTISVCLLSLVSLNFRSQRGRSSSRALASLLAEELRGAQLKARRDQRPVAVVFPSQGKSRPISQGFYVLEGYEAPKLRRMANFSAENSACQLMIGSWPVSSPATVTFGSSTSDDAIDLDAWIPTELQGDYVLVFLPSGRVQTNDLPMFNDAYHILVGAGIEYGGTATPSGTPTVTMSAPNYFSPTSVGEPYTVTVQSTGEVSFTAGVASLSGGVNVTGAFTPSNQPAPLVSLPVVANRSPVLVNIKVTPELDPALAPPGVDAQVQPDEHLTLEVTATDQDGDELFCQWTSDVGNFSSAEETRMIWDEATRTRRSVWTWQPPHDAVTGDPFTLTCTVRDSNGAVASPIVGSVLNGLTEAEGKLFYVRDSGGFRHAYTSKPDGTGERRLSNDDHVYAREVHTALDSSRIIYSAKAGGTGRYQIESSNVDGSNVQVIYAEAGRDLVWPRINPQGTHIIFNRGGELWMVDADGTNPRRMTFTSGAEGDNSYVSWSPDGSRIAWNQGQRIIKVMDLDPAGGFAPAGPEIIVLPNTGVRYHYVEWQPSAVEPRLLINGNSNERVFHVKPDPADLDRFDLPLIPGSTPGGSALACWSPDGTQILYGEKAKGVYVIDAYDATGATRRPVVKGAMDFPVWVQ